MYFRISKDVRMTSYNKTIIILDLIKNEYNILPEEISNVLQVILANEFKIINDKYILNISKGHGDLIPIHEDEFNEIIEYFIKSRYIELTNSPPYESEKLIPNIKKGANNIDWRINPEDIKLSCGFKDFFGAYLVLIKVTLISTLFNFKTLIDTVKVKNKSGFKSIISADSELQSITYTLNTACFYFPFRIKCLEWAVAFTCTCT